MVIPLMFKCGCGQETEIGIMHLGVDEETKRVGVRVLCQKCNQIMAVSFSPYEISPPEWSPFLWN